MFYNSTWATQYLYILVAFYWTYEEKDFQKVYLEAGAV